MPVNSSARLAQIFIGDKDFSSCFISFQGSDSHIDQSGLIGFTGSIVLGRSIGFDESLDDRKNPARFCRGVQIFINIANSSGALQRHPRGALRILNAKYEEEKQQLSLDVGDLIALLNFKEPTDPDKADNKSLQGSPAGAIITKLLHLAGITAIGGSLPFTNYNYPLNLSGSYLGSVGKLLYANNMVGWVDNQEVFRVQPVTIAAANAAVECVIGRDEIWYKRLDGVEAICEVVKASGSEMIVRPTGELLIDTAEEYGSAQSVDKNYPNIIIVTQRTKRTQEWNKASYRLRNKTEIHKPYGMVIPEIFWGLNPPKLTEIAAEVIIEDSYYERNLESKLKSKETRIYYPGATFLANYKKAVPSVFFSGIINLSLVKLITETYEYDAKNRLSKIATKVLEVKTIILDESDEDWSAWLAAPLELIPSLQSTQEWKQLNRDTWRYSSFTSQSIVRVDPELVKYQAGSKVISNKCDLIADSTKSVTRTSNSGQELPPATEHRPADYSIEENSIEEKALFTDLCNLNFKPRERTFSVDFLAGRVERVLQPGEVTFYQITGSGTAASNQLQAIAGREGRLLRGRAKGQELAMPMNDAIFGYRPLFTVRAIEQDGTVQNYLADGCSWVVSQTKALWNCDGIWVGTSARVVQPTQQQGQPPVVTYTEPALPYLEPQSLYFGQGLGCQFNSYSYPLEPQTGAFGSGMGHGIFFDGAPQLAFGIGLGLAWNVPSTTGQSNATWDDFIWDDCDWDNLGRKAATWDDFIWDDCDWDNLGRKASTWDDFNWDDCDWDGLGTSSQTWDNLDWNFINWETV
jgi:hypothetical protein